MTADYELMPLETEGTIVELSGVSTDELIQQLKARARITAQNLVAMAKIWGELERRGVDMAPLKRGLMLYIPLIARGDVVPEAVEKFAGSTWLLKSISQLPAPKQLALATGEEIEVMTPEGGSRLMPVEHLTQAERRLVFGNGVIRTPEEQRKIYQQPTRRNTNRVRVDHVEKALFIGHTKAPLTEVIAALKFAGYKIQEKHRG